MKNIKSLIFIPWSFLKSTFMSGIQVAESVRVVARFGGVFRKNKRKERKK